MSGGATNEVTLLQGSQSAGQLKLISNINNTSHLHPWSSQDGNASTGVITLNNISMTGILGLGGQVVGSEYYGFDDFLKDIKTAIVDMAGGIKEIKERLSHLETRFKIDNA